MPYIEPKRRLYDAETAGELNYMFTVVLNDYIKLKGESYQTYNDIIGALEGCKLELYRRLIAPYENEKCRQNGDVYNEKIIVKTGTEWDESQKEITKA